MLYWLADFSSTISVFNVFRYLTVRTGGSGVGRGERILRV